MLPTLDTISNLVENQFPEFYREEGPKFVAFIKAYYEWMEENENTFNVSRNLFSTRDIDQTASVWLEQFRKKYLYPLPTTAVGDKRFLQKHILDLYRSKGSIDGLKLFFRLVFDEDVDVYIPSVDILKPSDGRWVQKQYMEVTYAASNSKFENKQITGSQSGAKAFVESYVRSYTNGRISHAFYLSNIQGTFIIGERVAYDGLSYNDAPKIQGSAASIDVVSTTGNNNIGDTLLPTDGSGVGLIVQVSNTNIAGSANGTINFRVIDGGFGFTNSPSVSITAGSNSTGAGATFTGVILSNTQLFTYSTSYLDNSKARANSYSFNANTAVSNTLEFIAIANNAFANGDYVTYYTDAGNTAIGGLSNNSSYFVVGANSTGVKLSLGNTTTYNTAAVNLTSGSTETGHHLFLVPLSNLSLSIVTFGPTLNNSSLSSTLGSALSDSTITIGTISQLTGVSTGTSYNGYINVSVTEPKLAGYNIPDGKGGTLGLNATIYANVVYGTGLVNSLVVKDSGLGYHAKKEAIDFYNSTQSNSNQTTTGTVNLAAVGRHAGYWENSQSFLDSNKYIQDSYYYQEFSYEIKFVKSINKYIDVLKELIHPAGNEVFGKTFVFSRNDGEKVGVDNATTIFRIQGSALAPAPAGKFVFTLDGSRLV